MTNHTDPPCSCVPTPARSLKTGIAWITCNGCRERWTGLGPCHCAACHNTFTSPTGFDMHRRGGQCRYPADAGLVPIERLHWTGWGRPGEPPERHTLEDYDRV